MRSGIINPFIRIAGSRALIVGLLGILLAGMFGYLTGTHFDGVFDIHFSGEKRWYVFPAAGILNWLSLVLVFGVFSLLLAKGRFRWIDVLGTQAFARIPFILAPLAGLFLDRDRLSAQMTGMMQDGVMPDFSTLDITSLALTVLIILFISLWTITWSWHAYTHSANLKGSNAAISFIGGLILAELISKILMSVLLGYQVFPTLN